MDTFQSASNAKIILIGEHSVVYGEPAIAMPIKNIQTRVQVEPITGPVWIESRYYSGTILSEQANNLSGIFRLIEACFRRLNRPLQNVKITIDSDIPSERGMGSSASTAVAIVRGIFGYYNQPLNQTTLTQLTDISETVIHGNPSGLDVAATSSSLPIWYQKKRELSYFHSNLNGYLVIADSGVKGKTDEAVSRIRLKVSQNSEALQRIKHLSSLTHNARTAIELNQINDLGLIFDQAHQDLKYLGVSDPSVETLIKTANQNGALGSKLTGGGLGGCIIALSATKNTAETLKSALLNSGATEAWIERFG